MNENEKNDDIIEECPAPEEKVAPAETETEILEAEPVSHKKSMAWVRVTIAACLGILILCLTGFGAFKLLLGGGELTTAGLTAGKYLTFNVDTILDYLAEDYAADSDTVTGRYAIVSVDGNVAIVHFPQRYLDSADQIAAQTYYQLYGYTTADQYFVASGTVKKAPDKIVEEYKTWYNTNALALYQYGFIDNIADTENIYIVDVDSTGLFSNTVCTVLSSVAGVLMVYAAVVFILIKAKHYDDEITVEIFDDEAESEDNAEATENAISTEAETEEPESEEAEAEGAEAEEASSDEQETTDEP